MKLLNNLYHINNCESATDEAVVYHISLHKDAVIYQAHFPNHPITPGVCIIQIVKELLEDFTQQNLSIAKIKNTKFVSVLTPNDNPTVSCKLTKMVRNEGEIKFQALVYNNENTFAKLSLTCVAS